MQRQFSLLMTLLLLYVPAQAQFVEQFRSDPNLRLGKALHSILASNEYYSTARDMNRNGVPDRAALMPNGQSGVVLLVFDGLAQTPLWRFPLTQKTGFTDLDYLGFFDFKGDGTVSAMMLDGKGNDILTEEVVVCIINPSTNEVEFRTENARFFDVANVEFSVGRVVMVPIRTCHPRGMTPLRLSLRKRPLLIR